MKFDIDNLKLLNVLQCVSAPYREYRDRPSHALVFRRTGNILYDISGQQIPLLEGQVMFLPKGSDFTVTQTTPGVSRYTVVNFLGDFPLKQPQLLGAPANSQQVYAWLDRCCTLDPEHSRLSLLANFYRILAQLFETPQTAYHSRATLQLIAPAVTQLEKQLFDPELKTGSLHSLCGISDTYFRKLFIARYGVSPKKYILDRRLRHARALLGSGECAGVAEAAQLSGFSDPLYFSKCFRERYGYPPSQTAYQED